MQYLQSSFTVPVNNGRTSQQQWDRAFLTHEEFQKKYGPRETRLQGIVDREPRFVRVPIQTETNHGN